MAEGKAFSIDLEHAVNHYIDALRDFIDYVENPNNTEPVSYERYQHKAHVVNAYHEVVEKICRENRVKLHEVVLGRHYKL